SFASSARFAPDGDDREGAGFSRRLTVQALSPGVAALGYHTTHSILDVEGFGVPQRRQHLFFLGAVQRDVALARRARTWRAGRGAIAHLPSPLGLLIGVATQHPASGIFKRFTDGGLSVL